MAIISQPRERIFGGLLPQAILQLALLGNIFNDDLVTVFLAIGGNSAAAKPNLQRCAILSPPVNFNRSPVIFVSGLAEQLFPFVRVAKNVPGMGRVSSSLRDE